MQVLPKPSSELRSPIWHNCSWYPIQAYYLSYVYFYILMRSIVGSYGNEVHGLGQMVYNYPYWVKTLLSGWESNNEIHADLLPLLSWNRQRLEQSDKLQMISFDSTAIITPSDIGGDLFLYLGPPKKGFQILNIFLLPRWMDNGWSCPPGFRWFAFTRL